MSGLSASLLLTGETVEADDPYYICQRAIREKLDLLQKKFARWSSQFLACNTAEDEFQQLHKDVLQRLKAVKELYQTLNTSVQAVVRARQQFPNISNSEISARKRFATRTLKTLQKIEVKLESQETISKIVSDRRKLLFRGQVVPKTKHASSSVNSDYVDARRQAHEREMQEQEESVNMMINGLDQLHNHGVTIKTEIADHKQSLKGMTKNVSRARAGLQKLTGRMKGFLRTKDDCQLWTLLSLVILAVILLLMIVISFFI